MLDLLGLERGRRPQGRVAEPRRRPAGRDRPGADDRAASCCCSTSRRRVSTATRPTTLARDAARRCSASAGSRSCSSSTTSSSSAASCERVFVLDFGTLIASGPTDDGVRRRRGAQGLPRRHRLMAAVAAAPRPRRAAARAARRRRRLRTVPRALRRLAHAAARARARAARFERRGQDDDRARVLRARRADDGPGAASTATTSPGSGRTGYARRGIVHAPEGRSVFASLTVEENLELTFRRSRGRAGVQRRARRGVRRCSRGSVSGARSSRARSRAVSSACCRSRACSSRSRGC